MSFTEAELALAKALKIAPEDLSSEFEIMLAYFLEEEVRQLCRQAQVERLERETEKLRKSKK